MLEPKEIIRNIETIRNSKPLWKEFEYQEKDENYFKRYAAAVAIQYDWKHEDYEFIRFLMENEVESRTHDSFQGYGDSLLLLSYLLAKFRKPEHVWLYEKAKCANFDTYCGYFDEFLFSAGVENTCKYLEEYDLTKSNGYLFERKDRLRSLYSEEEIEAFLQRMASWFPDSIDKESTDSLLSRAIDFQDHEEADKLFAILEQEAGADTTSLFYRAKELKKYEKAISYKQKELASISDPSEKASALLNITELHVLNNDCSQAFASARQWEQLLLQFDSWRETGLGRSMSEAWFDICLGMCKEQDVTNALLCYENGKWMISKTNHVYLNLLKKVYACSEALQKKKDMRYYKMKIEKEKKKINRIKNRCY